MGTRAEVQALPRLQFVPSRASVSNLSRSEDLNLARLAVPNGKVAMNGLPPLPPLIGLSSRFKPTGGLLNVGTDCFFNSVLQIIANAVPLLVSLDSLVPRENGDKDALDVFIDMLTAMRTMNDSTTYTTNQPFACVIVSPS